MLTSDVRRHLSPTAVASALGINPSAVSQWREIVPESSARALAQQFPTLFTFDDALYAARRAEQRQQLRKRRLERATESASVEDLSQDLTPENGSQEPIGADPAGRG